MRACLALLLFVWAGSAGAGAWMRADGTGFASVAARFSWPQEILQQQATQSVDTYYSVYFEYGMTPRLTLGLDLGQSGSGSSKAVAFAQIPMRDADHGPKIAVALGFGQMDGALVLRPGLSVGWGLTKGWLSADALAAIGLEDGLMDLKLDITYGRKLQKDRLAIVQLQTGKPALSPAFAKLEMSLVRPLGNRLKLDMGVAWGLVEDQNIGLKLGLWTEF